MPESSKTTLPRPAWWPSGAELVAAVPAAILIEVVKAISFDNWTSFAAKVDWTLGACIWCMLIAMLFAAIGMTLLLGSMFAAGAHWLLTHITFVHVPEWAVIILSLGAFGIGWSMWDSVSEESRAVATMLVVAAYGVIGLYAGATVKPSEVSGFVAALIRVVGAIGILVACVFVGKWCGQIRRAHQRSEVH